MRRGNVWVIVCLCAGAGLFTSRVHAVPTINVGNYNLLANSSTPQDIYIPVTGGDTVTDFVMYAQIGDSVDGPDQPLFSDVLFTTNTLWSSVSSPLIGGTGPDAGGKVAQKSIGLSSGNIAAVGNVVHLQVTTLGINAGTFPLKLKSSEYGVDSLFLNTSSNEIHPNITNGTITIVPEPVSIGLLGLGAVMVGRRRRR